MEWDVLRLILAAAAILVAIALILGLLPGMKEGLNIAGFL